MARTQSGEIIVNQFRGINVHDNNFNIDDSQAQIATNVIVSNGAVECRGGLNLHSSFDSTGGLPFLYPYYKRDGTKQLIFANQNNYYY